MWENKWKLFPLQKSIFIMLSLGVKKLKKKPKKKNQQKTTKYILLLWNREEIDLLILNTIVA